MKTLRFAALWTLFLGALAIPAQTVTVSASHLGGPTPVTGTITFQPVAADGITAISARLGGGGLTTKKPITATVTAGAFTMPNVIDTSLSNPANVCYTVTVRDSTGLQDLGPGFTCVQPALNNSWCASGVCNFDTFAPAMPSLALTASGPPGATGAAGANGVASLAALALARAKSPEASLANLYNYAANAPTGNYVSCTNGALVALSGFVSTDFIPANAGGTITASAAIVTGPLGGYAFYDQNQAFVSGGCLGVAANTPITVPTTAQFLRLTFANAGDAPSAMVVWGSTMPTSYQAFGTYPSNVIDAHIAATSLSTAGYAKLYNNVLDPGAVVANSYIYGGAISPATGTSCAAAPNSCGVTGFIPVTPGGTLILNYVCDQGALGWFDASQNYVSSTTCYGSPISPGTAIAVPPTAYYARMTLDIASNAANYAAYPGSFLPPVTVPFGFSQLSPANLNTLNAAAPMALAYKEYTNLLDPAAVTPTAYINPANGQVVSLAGGSAYLQVGATGFFPVNPGQAFVSDTTLIYGGLAFYDKHKTFLSALATNTTSIAAGAAITPPANAYYARASIVTASAATSMFLPGTTVPALHIPFSPNGIDQVAQTLAVIPASPLAGHRLGVWGHSYTQPGYAYNSSVAGFWQTQVANALGMTWTFCDCLAGRQFTNFFSNYPGISLSNMTATSTGAVAGGGVNGGTTTTGTTLAQDLANVDDLIVWITDNDWNDGTPIGTTADGPTVVSLYGELNNIIQILYTAKPTLHIIPVMSFNGTKLTIPAYQAMEAFEQAEWGIWGSSVLDLFEGSGFNSLNHSVYINPGDIHPSTAGWQELSPIIARKMAAF